MTSLVTRGNDDSQGLEGRREWGWGGNKYRGERVAQIHTRLHTRGGKCYMQEKHTTMGRNVFLNLLDLSHVSLWEWKEQIESI